MKQKIIICMLLALSASLVACSGQREEPVRMPPQPAPLEESRPETAVANASNKFTGSLRSLNGSGVGGAVLITVDGEKITVRIFPEGLGSGRYGVGIHGFLDSRLSQGPPTARSVSASELARFTGPELLALAPLTASGSASAARYQTRLDGRRAYPLDIRALVMTRRSGSGRPVPVAYSLLKPAELGDGGIGGPGSVMSGGSDAGVGGPSTGAGAGGGTAGSSGGQPQGGGGSGSGQQPQGAESPAAGQGDQPR